MIAYSAFYVRDELFDGVFLVDTDAFLSVHPASDGLVSDATQPKKLLTTSSSGVKIPTNDSQDINLMQFWLKIPVVVIEICPHWFVQTSPWSALRPLRFCAFFLVYYSCVTDVSKRRLADNHYCLLSDDVL